MIKTPINNGILQSDLDVAGFDLLNFSGGGGGTGHGIPAGGTAGQSLTKIDATDYNAHWSTVTGGGGTDLDANTVLAADIGLVGDGVTDNTAALQAWLTSVGAAKVNSTLLVPDGVYIFSGALQDTSGANAQILLPSVNQSDPTYTVTIKGYHPISLIPWPDVSVPFPKGPVFKSTLASGGGSQPAFIGGIGPTGGVSPLMSFMSVCFENMIFKTVQNPLISCLNLRYYSIVHLRGDVLIIAGNGTGSSDAVQPTTSSSVGLILPPNSQSIVQIIDNVYVWNFYAGIAMGELSHISNAFIGMCIYAMQFGFSYHVSVIERVVDWWCKNGIKMFDTHPFQIEQHDVERAPASLWYTRVYDVDDPSNKAVADIAWWTVTAYIGADNTYTLNGGTGVKTRRIGSDITASPIYIGTDARLVSITGGTKLQVRNPGTGLWADGDQWTNP